MIGFHMRTERALAAERGAEPARPRARGPGRRRGRARPGRFLVNGKPVSEAQEDDHAPGRCRAAGDARRRRLRRGLSFDGGSRNGHPRDRLERRRPGSGCAKGVERKAFSGDGATVSLNRLQPGHEPRPHDHPHEQIVYILGGQIDFHVGETVTRLGAGGLLVVPPNARHWGVVVGDEPVLNLDVFTPKRAEYAA